MLTPEQKQAMKKALIQKCIDRDKEPYILRKNADITTFDDKNKSWDKLHKGSLVGFSLDDCCPVSERHIGVGGYYADQDIPMYIVKDIAIMEDEVIIETLGGKILTTLDLSHEWRLACIEQWMQKEEELMLGAIREGSMLSKIYTQSLCKELEIELPKDYKAELLAHLPSVIEAKYQDAIQACQERGEEFRYDGFFRSVLSERIENTIKNFDLVLQQQQADAMYQHCIESSKPVIAVEDKLIILNNSGVPKLTTNEIIKRGQHIHLHGIGTDCKSMSDDRIPLISDEVVVSHYTNCGHYMLETKNAIYTNIGSLQERVAEHTRQQAAEKLIERWGQSPITANIAPNMLSAHGNLPKYPTSDESHLIDLASESLPSGFDRDEAFRHDSWLLDRKIERYQESVNCLLTNVIQECIDKNVPIIKWNSNDVKFDKFDCSMKEVDTAQKCFNGTMVPQSGQEATLPNHCLMLDENGEWGPVPSEMRDIFVGETQSERSNFVMITDMGLITNYDIDGIVEQVLEMKQDFNGYDSQDLSDRQ